MGGEGNSSRKNGTEGIQPDWAALSRLSSRGGVRSRVGGVQFCLGPCRSVTHFGGPRNYRRRVTRVPGERGSKKPDQLNRNHPGEEERWINGPAYLPKARRSGSFYNQNVQLGPEGQEKLPSTKSFEILLQQGQTRKGILIACQNRSKGLGKGFEGCGGKETSFTIPKRKAGSSAPFPAWSCQH